MLRQEFESLRKTPKIAVKLDDLAIDAIKI